MADAEAQRRETLARQRRQWETETALNAVMSDSEVQGLKEEDEALEASLARKLAPMLRHYQERYDRAVQYADLGLLSRSCPGKHGRWGRICVLDAGHEAGSPTWGPTLKGSPWGVGFDLPNIETLFNAFGPDAADRIRVDVWEAEIKNYYAPDKGGVPADLLAAAPTA